MRNAPCHCRVLVCRTHSGFGGIPLPFEPSLAPIVPDVSAADFIVAKCAELPGQVTLVTLGPLSNIGTAISRNAGFAATVKRVVMMGGDTLGTGNKAPGGM